MNTLMELKEAGQSVWIDYLSRELIRSGELSRLIRDYGLCGVTSNPTIFQKAIEGSTLYDQQLQRLVKSGMTNVKELFLSLAMEDVGEAADLLFPVYESSRGRDGYVSIEVSPDLAYSTRDTIEEALKLFTTIGRKNVLVKVPATREGIPAIERLVAEGVNVNVTLLFSVRRYGEVMDAYIRGIEERAGLGLSLDKVNSVASFFVSRVDTMVDGMLDRMAAAARTREEKSHLMSLRGKAAVANAKVAYHAFREEFASPRFLRLKEHGARMQRLLFGSTSTKDPAYNDVKYVEELVGQGTVNTMPEETIEAFADHGHVAPTLESGLDGAKATIKELALVGIDIEEVASRLETEGVKKFADSYFDLLEKIGAKRDLFMSEKAA